MFGPAKQIDANSRLAFRRYRLAISSEFCGTPMTRMFVESRPITGDNKNVSRICPDDSGGLIPVEYQMVLSGAVCILIAVSSCNENMFHHVSSSTADSNK